MKDQLKKLIEQHGLEAVLSSIATVCTENSAEHIARRDPRAASAWSACEYKIALAASTATAWNLRRI